MTFHIRRKEALPNAVRRIARQQILTAITDIEGDRHPPDRAIHQFRKHCKKLRGILRLVRPLLGEVFAAEDAYFRKAAKQLKLDRELQVIRHTLMRLLADEPQESSYMLLQALEEPLQANDGLDANRDTETPLATAVCVEIMQNSLAKVDLWPLEMEEFEGIRGGFEKVYSHCRHAWTKVSANPNDANFHRLRKWTKYHWYHIRLLERINKPAMRASRAHLKLLEATLGDSNDLAELANSLPGHRNETEIIQGIIDKRKMALWRNATGLCQMAFSEDPRAYTGRHAAYWDEWRR